MRQRVVVRVKPGRVKVGASLTSQIITLNTPAPKVIDRLNEVTKDLPYHKVLVQIIRDEGPDLTYNLLYPGDAQVVQTHQGSVEGLRAYLDDVRREWGLQPTPQSTLKGIVKSIR